MAGASILRNCATVEFGGSEALELGLWILRLLRATTVGSTLVTSVGAISPDLRGRRRAVLSGFHPSAGASAASIPSSDEHGRGCVADRLERDRGRGAQHEEHRYADHQPADTRAGKD